MRRRGLVTGAVALAAYAALPSYVKAQETEGVVLGLSRGGGSYEWPEMDYLRRRALDTAALVEEQPWYQEAMTDFYDDYAGSLERNYANRLFLQDLYWAKYMEQGGRAFRQGVVEAAIPGTQYVHETFNTMSGPLESVVGYETRREAAVWAQMLLRYSLPVSEDLFGPFTPNRIFGFTGRGDAPAQAGLMTNDILLGVQVNDGIWANGEGKPTSMKDGKTYFFGGVFSPTLFYHEALGHTYGQSGFKWWIDEALTDLQAEWITEIVGEQIDLRPARAVYLYNFKDLKYKQVLLRNSFRDNKQDGVPITQLRDTLKQRAGLLFLLDAIDIMGRDAMAGAVGYIRATGRNRTSADEVEFRDLLIENGFVSSDKKDEFYKFYTTRMWGAGK